MLGVQDRIATRFTKDFTETHLVPDDHVEAALEQHAHLTGEQRRLVTGVVSARHRFQAAIGRAGAGKTTTVAACRCVDRRRLPGLGVQP